MLFSALCVLFVFVGFYALCVLFVSVYLYVFSYLSSKNGGGFKKTLVVLGSGGHTTEMITLLKSLDLGRFQPRCYFIADTDKMSEQRMLDFLEKRRPAPGEKYSVVRIRRSREVGQSWLSSCWTTLVALAHSAGAVYTFRPDLVG